ncbi:hypothetical protein L484_014584 [Morus notabilis]|uniref:Uncharacterized protein n=1 Tax=Morus notabilis TaxID=981085 RepID=W9RU21_9ROSA|nr:hypothetical protein L484_014584 [Morus notabilis]
MIVNLDSPYLIPTLLGLTALTIDRVDRCAEDLRATDATKEKRDERGRRLKWRGLRQALVAGPIEERERADRMEREID